MRLWVEHEVSQRKGSTDGMNIPVFPKAAALWVHVKASLPITAQILLQPLQEEQCLQKDRGTRSRSWWRSISNQETALVGEELNEFLR